MAATIKYFGGLPTTIVMKSSNNFDGSAQIGIPVLSPGSYVFPVQALGGLYNFHDETVEVLEIEYKGGGTCVLTKVNSATSVSVTLATLTDSASVYATKLTLQPNESLKAVSSGATTPQISFTGQAALRWKGSN